MNSISVELLRYTRDGDRLVAAAAQQSLSKSHISKHLDPSKWGDEKVKKWIKELMSRKHMSPLEHSTYTFYIEGISRVCSHQLVRHRIASYTQFSQRWKSTPEEFVVPPRILAKESLYEEYYKFVKEAYNFYNRLLNSGIPPEDARYVLPQAITTKMIVTVNARELIHIVSLRTCTRAQWELRFVAWKMLKEAMQVHPSIFEGVGPRCIIYGRCPEGVPRSRVWNCIKQGLKVLLDLEDQETYNILYSKIRVLAESIGADVEEK